MTGGDSQQGDFDADDELKNTRSPPDGSSLYQDATGYEEGFYIPIDPKTAKKEKAAAREIKQSQWWHNQKSAGVCYWCQGHFAPADLTMDHKLPIAQGGRTTRKNVVPACKECNFTKKNMSPGAWEAYLKDKGRQES